MVNEEVADIIPVDEAKTIILSKYKDSIITAIMKLKDGYLFAIKPKNWSGGVILQPFFKVSNDGKLTEYSSVANPSEFKEAMKNRIY